MNERDRGELTNFFLEKITSAYSIQSYGMGVHLYAVHNMVSSSPLSSLEQNSIGTYSSNYLKTPYVGEWINPNISGVAGPKFECPRSKLHIGLLRETIEKYRQLHWEIMRLLLGGEQGLNVKQPGQPISAEELPNCLRIAVKNGVVIGNNEILKKVKPRSRAQDLYNNIIKAGAEVFDGFLQQQTDIIFSDRFRDKLSKAAIYQLGAMLALSDQLAYDASSSGAPIPYNFMPKGYSERWKSTFGESVPSFGGLYEKAHSVFTSIADPNDKLVRHLFPLSKLPYLI